MEYFASGALSRHGAEEDAEPLAQRVESADDAESLYMLELPTLSVEASLEAAVRLRLRPDPERSTGGGKIGAACEKASTYLLGPPDGEKDKRAACAEAATAAVRNTFPVVGWLPKTTLDSFKSDIIAGVTVGVMVIPQSMSYASIAGLEYVYGLYASMTPTLIYAVTGGSGQLAVGPVAMVSLLVEAGLRDALDEDECPAYFEDDAHHRALAGDDSLAGTCPDAYAELVFVTMFFAGLIQFGGSLCKLGFLVNFLGHPVVSGFTSGAAIIIGLSQVKYWLGVALPKSQYVYVTLGLLGGKIARGEAKWMCAVLGAASYGMLWGVRKLSVDQPKRFGFLKPMGPLVVCATSLVLMVLCPQLRDDYGVEVIGLVPSGLPPSSFGVVKRDALSKASLVLPTALSAALIGFMESIAIGKSLAAKHGDELPAGQEMCAIGLANIVGSLASGYPVAGSFSRSAVSNSIGAKTPLAGFVTGMVVLLALVALPDWIRKLPKFVLASIVISSVVNLVAISEAKHLWHVQKKDFVLWVLACFGVLFLGVIYGLAIAVGVSLAIVLSESVRPQIAVLWKLPGTSIFRNVKQGESPGQFVKGVLVLRVGASMYFANVAYIKETILKLCGEFGEGDTQYVVVEMTPVMSLDSTAIHMLEDLFADLRRRGMQVCLASCGSRVEETLRRAGAQRKLGYEWFHDNVQHAVEWCVRHRAASKALVKREDVAPSDDDDDDDGVVVADADGGARRRKPAKDPSTKSVLVLASKHRVVDRPPARPVSSLTPEQRALAAMASLDDSELGEVAASGAAPPPPPATPSLASKRDTVQALRLVVRQNGGMGGANPVADGLEAIAPPTVVALPDPESPDRLLLVACDVVDRPGIMRDISDVLASSLAMQIRYTEAAVVGRRSITFWRCEAPARGADRVAAAAAKAEGLILAAL
ncbi:sulfate transporter [Aureococcus anophagefferens]|uniref:Sulfate transporter n=2 Tax=Aureococcus anophagefferens TaxID=44056 RepID=A0ABR1FZY4_AURAN